MAAYILEKFSTWTDKNWRSLPDGGLTRKYRLTDLLDNVMIYWVTGSITTSMRLYSETISKAQFALQLDRLVSEIYNIKSIKLCSSSLNIYWHEKYLVLTFAEKNETELSEGVRILICCAYIS